MSSFDYAMGLFSVLTALALGDIAISFHKLLRNRRTVLWDGRVLVSALLVTVTVLRLWFAFWNVRESASLLAFPFYLSIFVELMVLFLLAAACLPDDPPTDCDLSAYYEKNRTYFWIVFAAFETSYVLHGLLFDGPPPTIFKALSMVLPIISYGILALSRVRVLHYALPLLLIAYQLIDRWNDTLS